MKVREEKDEVPVMDDIESINLHDFLAGNGVPKNVKPEDSTVDRLDVKDVSDHQSNVCNEMNSGAGASEIRNDVHPTHILELIPRENPVDKTENLELFAQTVDLCTRQTLVREKLWQQMENAQESSPIQPRRNGKRKFARPPETAEQKEARRLRDRERHQRRKTELEEKSGADGSVRDMNEEVTVSERTSTRVNTQVKSTRRPETARQKETRRRRDRDRLQRKKREREERESSGVVGRVKEENVDYEEALESERGLITEEACRKLTRRPETADQKEKRRQRDKERLERKKREQEEMENRSTDDRLMGENVEYGDASGSDRGITITQRRTRLPETAEKKEKRSQRDRERLQRKEKERVEMENSSVYAMSNENNAGDGISLEAERTFTTMKKKLSRRPETAEQKEMRRQRDKERLQRKKREREERENSVADGSVKGEIVDYGTVSELERILTNIEKKRKLTRKPETAEQKEIRRQRDKERLQRKKREREERENSSKQREEGRPVHESS